MRFILSPVSIGIIRYNDDENNISSLFSQQNHQMIIRLYYSIMLGKSRKLSLRAGVSHFCHLPIIIVFSFAHFDILDFFSVCVFAVFNRRIQHPEIS